MNTVFILMRKRGMCECMVLAMMAVASARLLVFADCKHRNTGAEASKALRDGGDSGDEISTQRGGLAQDRTNNLSNGAEISCSMPF